MAVDSMGRRARRALVALVAIAAALGVAGGGMEGCARASGLPEASGGTASLGQAMLEGAALAEALGAQGFDDGADGAPSWFREEVLPPEACPGAYATQDWSVVGFSRAGPATEAFSGLVQELGRRGWCAYDSGVEGAATLVKEEGEVRWMMLQCAEAGGSTSVVLQLRPWSC